MNFGIYTHVEEKGGGAVFKVWIYKYHNMSKRKLYEVRINIFMLVFFTARSFNFFLYDNRLPYLVWLNVDLRFYVLLKLEIYDVFAFWASWST